MSLLKTPPSHIVRMVKNYDSLLRVRWSREKGKFIVERKVMFRNPKYLPLPYRTKKDGYGREIKECLPANSDSYIQWHDSYAKIIETPVMDERLIRYLYEGDAHRYGKYFIQRYEEAERKREERESMRESDELMAVSGEVYDHMAYASGSRRSMAGGIK